MTLHGSIFQIRRFSTHDGPGIRTTVFLKGCPLECVWCHNPEGQSAEPELVLFPRRCTGCGACLEACRTGAAIQRTSTRRESCTVCGDCVAACAAEARTIAGWDTTVSGLMAEIQRDTPFYDRSGGGATFSGGEPTFQPGFLEALMSACREAGIHTCLDTSGACEPEVLERIRELADLFLYDVKLPDDPGNIDRRGIWARQSLPNLRSLSDQGAEIILRYVVIPGFTDGRERACRFAELVLELHGEHTVELLPYHATWTGKLTRLGRKSDPCGLPAGGDGASLESFRTVLEEEGVTVL